MSDYAVDKPFKNGRCQTLKAMKETVFTLRGAEFIELIKLLKLLRLAESGGQAKLMVEDGIVQLNGEVEYRKRAKLRPGDLIVTLGQTIRITE